MKNLFKKNQLMITALAIMIAVAGYLQLAGEELGKEDYLATSGGAEVFEGVDAENFTAAGVDSDAVSLKDLLDLSEEDLLSKESGQLGDISSLETDIDVIADNYLETGMEVTGAETADGNTQTQVAEGGNEAGTLSDNTLGATPEKGEIPGEAVYTSGLGISTLSDAKLAKEQTRAKNKETLLEIINSAGLTDTQKQSAVDVMVQMTAIAEKETAAELLLEAKGFSDVIVSIDEDGVDVVVNALELTAVQRAQIEDIVKRKTEIDAANIIISTVVQ